MASNIKINSNDNEIKDNDYNIAIQSSPTLLSEYHEDAIRQSNLIVKNAIFMIWVGILLIIGSFVTYATGVIRDSKDEEFKKEILTKIIDNDNKNQ